MGRDEIVRAFSVEDVSEIYQGEVHITDLKNELGTRGHVFVVRGDRALESELMDDELDIATPKLWLYEGLIRSAQEKFRSLPDHKLFDGVGFSGLAALGHHARKIGRGAVAVFAREFIPNQDVVDRYGIEVIRAMGPAEEGYVKAQAEVIRNRSDIIPLHQALHGTRVLAPVGNRVAKLLDQEFKVSPDMTFWCIASGSSLFGIGGKISQRFPGCRTIIVEPKTNVNLEFGVDFSNPSQIKNFARGKLKQYGLEEWVAAGKSYAGVFPLHVSGPNRYLLEFWRATGKSGFDETRQVSTGEVNSLQTSLASLSPEYNWTKSTALTLQPALEEAREGRNVLVMAYGRNRETPFREFSIE